MTPEDKIFVEGPEFPRTEVEIINTGEEFEENGKGQIPNHEKIEIVYPQTNS